MIFDGLILDIDGTLWDTTEIVANAWNVCIEKFFPSVKKVSAKILKGEFGKPMNVIAQNLFPELSDIQQTELMAQCCIEEHKALEQNTKNLTFPEVVKTIKNLSAKIPIFIVSNCQEGYIELVMKKNSIESYIKDFESYGHTKNGKDKNILAVVKRNGLTKPLYVGDTQGDFDACKNAGVDFVFADYGFGQLDEESKNKTFATIKSFSQIETLL